jgi:acetylglutamate kinase
VLDEAGTTVQELEPAGIDQLISSRTATAGMVAKLRACADALSDGVGDVVIADGRDESALVDAVVGKHPAGATRIRSDVNAWAARR